MLRTDEKPAADPRCSWTEPLSSAIFCTILHKAWVTASEPWQLLHICQCRGQHHILGKIQRVVKGKTTCLSGSESRINRSFGNARHPLTGNHKTWFIYTGVIPAHSLSNRLSYPNILHVMCSGSIPAKWVTKRPSIEQKHCDICQWQWLSELEPSYNPQ